MRRFLVICTAVVAAAIACAVPASATVPLTDWGGPIISSANVHVLYWGTSWTTGDSEVNSFVPAFVGSTYVDEANEYERGGTVSLSYSETTVDSTSSPATNVRQAAVKTELQSVYGTLDTSGLYVVLGDTYGAWQDGGACAWHDYISVGTSKIPVEYVPDDFVSGTPAKWVAACDTQPPFYFGTWDYGKVASNRIAHETLEAITDPQPCTALATCQTGRGDVAWDEYDGTAGNLGGEGEIADLCYAVYNNYTLTDSSVWLLQEEWSNSASACI